MLFIGNSSNSGLFCTCCRYRLTSSTVTIGRFISWVVFVFVFGGDACFCFCFFFFLFVLLFAMTGGICRSVGGVCGLFVAVIGRIFVFACFCYFFLLFFLITSMSLKRLSQAAPASLVLGVASNNIPQIISRVSSSYGFSNNVA